MAIVDECDGSDSCPAEIHIEGCYLSEPEEDIPSIEDFLKMMLVVQMRLYDVQLSLLLEQNKEVGLELINRHKDFKNIGPLPYLENE